jgi:hypothetical protein
MVSTIKPGQTLTGAQFIALKTTLGELFPKVAGVQKPIIKKYSQELDELLKANLIGGKKPGPSGKYHGGKADIWQRYKDVSDHYSAGKAFLKAVEKKNKFSPTRLAEASRKSLNPQKKSMLQKGAEAGVESLENFPSKQGAFVTLAATSAAASPMIALGGLTGAGAALGMAILGGYGFASKTVQRALSGQLRGQRLTKIMKK